MKILIFHAGGLGDLVNTAPALRSLRARFAEAAITLAGPGSFIPLFSASGLAERTLSLESHGLHELWSEAPLSREVKGLVSSHDLAVSWVRSEQLLDRLRGLGLSVAAFSGPFPPPPGSGHVSEVLAGPLRELGINESMPPPRLVLSPAALAEGPRFSGVILHPGSGSRHKNWPAENFVRVGEALHREAGLELALLCGPADEGPVKAVAAGLGPKVKALFSGLSIVSLASLLAGGRLFVGNDSGVSHLAGAVGAPVAAVYGPTDPSVWGVRQDRARNLSAGVDCSPCSREEMAGCGHKVCLDRLRPETVAEAALELLSRGGGPGSADL